MQIKIDWLLEPMKIQVWKRLGAQYVELINISVEERRFMTEAKLSSGEIDKLCFNCWETLELIWRGARWRSGESAHLPPMCPGFDSRTRRHLWLEFVVGSLPCPERFFSGFSGYLLSSKTNISKFQFYLDYCKALCHEPLARVIVQALPMFDIKFKLTFFMLINVGVNNCGQSI